MVGANKKNEIPLKNFAGGAAPSMPKSKRKKIKKITPQLLTDSHLCAIL